jgi:hypothetical protein
MVTLICWVVLLSLNKALVTPAFRWRKPGNDSKDSSPARA